ncbi:hypothetical protein, partial [Plasmodium yoelii yoelii]
YLCIFPNFCIKISKTIFVHTREMYILYCHICLSLTIFAMFKMHNYIYTCSPF